MRWPGEPMAYESRLLWAGIDPGTRPLRPGKAGEGLQIRNSEVIANGGHVEHPEIEAELIVAIPGKQTANEINDTRTENEGSHCVDCGKNHGQQQVEKKSHAGEVFNEINNYC